MRKLALFIFICAYNVMLWAQTPTRTIPLADVSEHAVFLETDVQTDYFVWAWDGNGHGGDYFFYNTNYPGEKMVLVGKMSDGKYIYKCAITKTSDLPTDLIISTGSEEADKLWSSVPYQANSYYVKGETYDSAPQPATTATLETTGRNVIYELNVGMFTTEGTFTAATSRLQDLKNLGVDIIWLMPIFPRGTAGINSPYAANDFEAVNPNYGTVTDLTSFVNAAHNLGMEVWLDWVPNHTATDHVWVSSHPEYYTKDSNNQFVHPNNYGDVYELDYTNDDLCAEMTRIMRQWITTCDIDGFRNDYASSKTIPATYWKQCILNLRQTKRSLKMMAEADLTESGNSRLKDCDWDYDYAMSLQTQMKTHQNDASALKSAIKTFNQNNGEVTFGRMTYITNHDINGNNDGGTLSTLYGNNRYALTVMSFTLDGMPLIYNGQEIGDMAVLDYFSNETRINWTQIDPTMQTLVSTLASLKHQQMALTSGPEALSSTSTLMTNQQSVLAYVRNVGNEAILVVLNVGNSSVDVRLTDLIAGTYTQLVKGSNSAINTTATEVSLSPANDIQLDAHGYAVYKLKSSSYQYLAKATTVIYTRDLKTPSPIEPVTLYSWYDEGGTIQFPFGDWGTARDYPTYTRWQDNAGNVWMRYVISEAPTGTNNLNVIAVANEVQTDNLTVNGGSKNNFITINSGDGTNGGDHYQTVETGVFSNSELAALTQMKRKVRVFVQDAYNAVPHLYVWYHDENGVTVEPQGRWEKAITLNNYTVYESTLISGNTADWYCYTIEVPDGQSFNAIAYSNDSQSSDVYIGSTVTEYYIMKDGTANTQSGVLNTTDANKFTQKTTIKDIDIYVRDESGAIVRLYAKYENADGSFEYEPLGDKQSAFATNLEVCLSDAQNSDGQKIWYHRKFRDVNTDYKVSIIAYANYRQFPDMNEGDVADTDNYYVVSNVGESTNKTVYLVIKTLPSSEASSATEKTFDNIVLTPQKTKDYTVYVRKDTPTAVEQESGEYLLNLYSWYTIDGNVTVFEPSAMWPGTQLSERYIDENGQIWYCLHLNGIPFELYNGQPNSTLMAIVNQNGDEDKSQGFNITEATGNEGHEIFLVYHGLDNALTVETAPERLDDYPEAEGGGTFYLVSEELTSNAKLPQFRFTPSRNRSMSGQDGNVNANLLTLNLKDDEIAKRLNARRTNTFHYRIVRGDGNTNFDFRPRRTRDGYELGSGSAATTQYNGTGGTGYRYEEYPYSFSHGTTYTYTLQQGTAQSYTFFIETSQTASESLAICMNNSIPEDEDGYYLIGNINNTIAGASWTPANSNARMLMVRNEYKNPADEAVTDSIVYTVTVPRPSNGWGNLYLGVSPASRLADNEWDVVDWAYVLRPQVQYQKDGLATEGGLFAHGEGVSSGDQSFNPSRFNDVYESFTFSINLTTSTYRFLLNRGLYIIGDAISEKIDVSKDEWDPSNARALSYDESGKYWFIENVPLRNGKLRFANDKLMTNCFVENDYRPEVPGTANGKKGPEGGKEETQYVNILKWRNEGVNDYSSLTNSQKADDISFLLPVNNYNIRFYIRSKVENVGSGLSGNVSNDEYYIFYVIDPVYDFVGVNSTVNILNPLTNANGDRYTFYKPFSSYHALEVPDGVDVFYIKTLDAEEKTVQLHQYEGDVIPRNSGVILASAAPQAAGVTKLRVNLNTYDDPWNEPDELDGNLLKPLLVSRTLEKVENGKYNYIFGYKKRQTTDEGVTLGYYQPGTGSAQSNTSYLQISEDLFPTAAGSAPALRLVMWANDMPTDIALPANAGQSLKTDQAYYTLSGVRLNGVPTQRGIYLYQGKKIVVK